MKFLMPLHEEIFIQFNYMMQSPKGVYRGRLEISTSTSQHQHRHWNQHCHRQRKKFIFAFQMFFLKIEFQCSFLSLIMTLVPLCYKYLFLYDLLFIHSQATIGVLQNGYFNFRKHSSFGVLKKITDPKILAYFAYFPAKHSG